MTNKKKANASRTAETRKPFMKGTMTDENTIRRSLGFAGVMVLVIFVSFIVSASATFDSMILRILLNTVVIFLQMMILFNHGSRHGAEDVARGEIIYQKNEKGQPFSESERRICYHPMKGFVNGFFGILPILLISVILAAGTTVQMGGAGTLPSWMQAYTRRSDIGSALVNYTQPEGMAFPDYIRMLVRICILPFVNLVGQGNKQGLLTLERLSPVIVLLPALSYGTGYLTGRKIRTKIHTTISANDQKRIRMEKKARKARAERQAPREPEQLN